MPTGSFKDRGGAVLLHHIHGLGISDIVEDSSGNAGASIAAYAAAAGIKSRIFVPSSTSPAKTAQISAYGAEIVSVPGSREDTAAAALEAAESSYYASHSWNPFFFQGTKTAAFEIAEQLNWTTPDAVIVPCGNGTLLLGLAIGFRDLNNAGIIRQLPKLIAIQAENCSPIYRYTLSGRDDREMQAGKDDSGQPPRSFIPGKTIATGIAIAKPVRLKQIVSAVTESKGKILTVTDEEILDACHQAWSGGLYIEETAAVSIAGCKNYLDLIDNDNELVIAVLTGHGLKRTTKGTE